MGHNKQERKRKETQIREKKKKNIKKQKQRRFRGDDVGGDNHVQEARFFPVYLVSFFLLKYSFRRAMLQLEFGESKPEESQSEQSITETRKAVSCWSETLKSNAGSGPAAAGCPVSNPDNLWKSPLLIKKLNSTERGALFDLLRPQGDDHCACAQKWCHFSYFSESF